MKREIAMIAFVLLGMGMTASAQFGKKINLGKALQAGKEDRRGRQGSCPQRSP